MFFNIIVAYDNQNGIGYKNKLSWYIKSDLNRFKNYYHRKYRNYG